MGGYSVILIANLTIVLFVLGNHNSSVVGNPLPKEKVSTLIEKLRKNLVPQVPQTSYVYEFSKHDLYLLRWLEDSSYDLAQTEQRILNHLEWRKEEKMDSIDQEDWSEWQSEYPIYTDTVDKIGSPVGEAYFSEWNVRKAVVAGQTKKLNRWVNRLAEIQTRRLYGGRLAGFNVTHSLVLWDLAGFNLGTQGCTPCTSIYINMAKVYETHYPGLWGGILLINMNQAFDSILKSMQPFLKPSTKQVMHSFYSKKKWMALLDRLVERKQRSARFGGTIQRHY